MTNGIPPRTNVIASEVVLLPCPFCGGEAQIVSDYSSERDETRWNLWHECNGHEGESNGYGYSLHPWFETPWYKTEAEAIAAWNARAEDTASTEMAQRIQSLELECAKLQDELRKAGNRGTLTAEQVRDAWCSNLKRDCLYDPPSPDWQAIADELNKVLGVGECEMVTSGTPSEGNTDKRCTACGAYNIGEYYDGLSHIASPRFCPNCGKRVVKR